MHARGLCQKHYDQSRSRDPHSRAASGWDAPRTATGEEAGLRPREPGLTTCSFPGCSAPHHAKGYCKSHYSRAKRRGRSKGGDGRTSQCEIAGCSRLAVRNRRCAEHLKVIRGGPRRMTRAERLGEIRRRHELMRREIERIRQSFDDEGEDE